MSRRLVPAPDYFPAEVKELLEALRELRDLSHPSTGSLGESGRISGSAEPRSGGFDMPSYWYRKELERHRRQIRRLTDHVNDSIARGVLDMIGTQKKDGLKPWRCSCGVKQRASARHCDQCGAERPKEGESVA